MNPAMRSAWLLFIVAISPRGKQAFIRGVPRGGTLLDVGCGNNSPYQTKRQRADIRYTGVDIGDYQQTTRVQDYAERYVLTTPERFAAEIAGLPGGFDAVISAHNLEHCLEPDAVLRAMCAQVGKGGRLYLSFPCEASLGFPRRAGSLNFNDDYTHRTPPVLKDVLASVQAAGLRLDSVHQRYRPIIPLLLGLVLEPLSFARRRVMPLRSTWALYGFETVIWASRPA